MLSLSVVELPDEVLKILANFQAEIDQCITYADQVKRAQELWPVKSRNVSFNQVRNKLKEMSHQHGSCGYCEDSEASEIDHFYPKRFYPQFTFDWDNFLYSCSICNRAKSDRFSIFVKESQERLDLHKRILSESPPIDGNPLLINPRFENPLDLIFLDLSNEFRLTPFADNEESIDWVRANYTIELLRLNRDFVIRRRKKAYQHYMRRLIEMVKQKKNGAFEEREQQLQIELKTEIHPTVWEEMKRQKAFIPELEELFQELPEVFYW